jgi:hypothetical protein
MTLSEIRTDVWEELGEPPNCDPATPAGLARLDGWINRGYKKILFWKFPDGSRVQFPATEGEVFFKSHIVTGTISSGTTKTVTLDASAGANDGQYNGWVLDASSLLTLIVAYDGSSRTATLATTLAAAPTGAYSLYKRFMKLAKASDVGAGENIILSSVSAIKEVQKIICLEDETEIVPAERTETFANGLTSPGRPSSYFRRGAQIIFDCPMDEELWYHMEYVRIPPDLTLDTDEPEMPETFHEAIMMWALWRGYHWMQETDMAYSTKRDIIDFMSTTRSPGEMSLDREDAMMVLENW